MVINRNRLRLFDFKIPYTLPSGHGQMRGSRYVWLVDFRLTYEPLMAFWALFERKFRIFPWRCTEVGYALILHNSVQILSIFGAWHRGVQNLRPGVLR
jgi:hypothetical protein